MILIWKWFEENSLLLWKPDNLAWLFRHNHGNGKCLLWRFLHKDFQSFFLMGTGFHFHLNLVLTSIYTKRLQKSLLDWKWRGKVVKIFNCWSLKQSQTLSFFTIYFLRERSYSNLFNKRAAHFILFWKYPCILILSNPWIIDR